MNEITDSTTLRGLLGKLFPIAEDKVFDRLVGEASASPIAFSPVSDYFPPRFRAPVLAIYTSGAYGGMGLGIFVGAPGLLLALWVGRAISRAPRSAGSSVPEARAKRVCRPGTIHR